MKRLIAALLVLSLSIIAVIDCNLPVIAQQHHNELKRMDFLISGTECPVCLNRIHTKLEKTPGVTKVIVWLWHPHYAMVVFDPSQTNWTVIKHSIADESVQLSDFHESNYQ